MNVPPAPYTPSAASRCRCGFQVGQISEGLHQQDQARAGIRDGLGARIGEQPSGDAAQLTQPRPAPAEDRAQEFGQREQTTTCSTRPGAATPLRAFFFGARQLFPLPAQILDRVDDHSGPDRNHQNVGRRAHLATAGRRQSDLYHKRLRHFVIDHARGNGRPTCHFFAWPGGMQPLCFYANPGGHRPPRNCST